MPRPEIPRSILVVEDAWPVALDIETMLEEAGHTVAGPARKGATVSALIQANATAAGLPDVTSRSGKSCPIAENPDESGVPLTFIGAYGKKGILAFRKFDLPFEPITPEPSTR